LERDIIGLRDEKIVGESLLEEAMRDGKTIAPRPSLAESREILAAEFAALPRNTKAIRDPSDYPVDLSPKLKTLRDETVDRLARS
jgi:hypothetical protein